MLLLSAGAALLGCPQLLEDRFQNEPGLPETSLDSGGSRQHDAPDASVELAGSGGAPAAGGAASVAGAGNGGPAGAAGSSLAGASNAGAAGDSGTLSDAGTQFQPATELGALLAHRYRFNGSGSTISDELGTANGTAVSTSLSAGSGKLSLPGSEAYVDLPNGLVSGLDSVTLEAWVNWLANPASPGADWQTVFDFGSSGVEDAQSSQTQSRVYLTCQSSVSGHLRAGYTLTDYNHEVFVDASRTLPASADSTKGTQLVLVVDGTAHSLAIYIDGTAEGTVSSPAISLAAITDVNNWLGRSQYTGDPEFEGELLDVRIYSAALSDEQVALSFSLGADADL